MSADARRVVTASEQETDALGRRLADALLPGDVLLLSGELGAGKSVLARGIARGLGVTEPVTSPTFTLMHIYEGRLPLHHFDLYRLSGDEAFAEAGLDEYIGGASVSLVEWPERAAGMLPECHLRIQIDYGEREGERVLTCTPMGGFREVTL